jgi:hypothetical protein
MQDQLTPCGALTQINQQRELTGNVRFLGRVKHGVTRA